MCAYFRFRYGEFLDFARNDNAIRGYVTIKRVYFLIFPRRRRVVAKTCIRICVFTTHIVW